MIKLKFEIKTESGECITRIACMNDTMTGLKTEHPDNQAADIDHDNLVFYLRITPYISRRLEIKLKNSAINYPISDVARWAMIWDSTCNNLYYCYGKSDIKVSEI